MEKQVFTCSIHCRSNFPFRKAESDLDVEIEKGCGDKPYLKEVFETFDGIFHSWRPDFVFYDAGVDVHKKDALGSLNISDEGLLTRDVGIISRCVKHGVPIATVIGGGYDPDHFALAARHGIIFKAALTCLADH